MVQQYMKRIGSPAGRAVVAFDTRKLQAATGNEISGEFFRVVEC